MASMTMKRFEDWSALLRDIWLTGGVGYLLFLVLVDKLPGKPNPTVRDLLRVGRP